MRWKLRIPPGRHRRTIAIAAAAALLGTAAVASATPTGKHAGPAGDGTAIAPTGYRITPAGRQTTLGDLPTAAALSPDRSTLLVVNAGQGTQSVQVVDPASADVVQTLPYDTPKAVFGGAAFSPDGSRAYISGGGTEQIHVYDVAGGRLTETAPLQLPTKNPQGKPVNMYPTGLAVTPDGQRLVVADQLADAATVVDLATGATHTVPVGHDPYGVALSKDGGTAYVTDQGANTVSVLDLTGADPVVRSTITVGTHPNAALLDPAGTTLYVADADSDQVSVIATATGTVTRTVDLRPYPGAQVGSNPDALALSPDGRSLYVADSGDNDLAVVSTADGRTRGLIPTAWYPTGVVADGGRLYVVNAKGLGAGPNDGPGYPNPVSSAPQSPDQYSGSMIKGTLSTIDLSAADGADFADWTQTVVADDGFATHGALPGPGGSVVPARAGGVTPIKHVIYVLKENRTYDQEFGSLGKGNGDPQLNLFGDDSAPNSRALERRFATLDNFYANAEVSAQGWNWGVAANSDPYAEQTWVANYSGRNHPYPSENHDPAIAPNTDPSDAYIWDRLADKGVSFRNYGFYVGQNSAGQAVAGDPRLNAETDHAFRGFDLNCPDTPGTFTPLITTCGTPRIAEWQREFAGYVAGGDLPTVEFVRLPNDHTSGTRPGSPTPMAYVADNDWALGRLVDTVSHSPYWKSTAIFVTEDDAQNGPDHVDAHRTLAQVISPYTQAGRVDSTFYNTASMLHTIELLVGLTPMTQFDAYAPPMAGSFTFRPDFTPYTAVQPATSLTAVNGPSAPMASVSAGQDLTREDQINEQEFNEAIWKSVRGADSVMPAPKHSLFGAVPNDQVARDQDD